MMTLLSCFIAVGALSGLVILLGSALSMKLELDREKNSPFECGFTPKFSSRLPFSMRFFLVSIVFLIFDVEIVLVFPFLSSLMMSGLNELPLLIFLLILLVGLYHEINEGAIDWAS